jgi:molybdopterin-synthase adenylyltransferase
LLTDRDLARYERQILFRPIGQEGQARLKGARVAVAGVGALGACAASQMARGGVGYLRLIDRDAVELSNLQRQMLFTEADVEGKRKKAEIAAERLRAANSGIVVESVVAEISVDNADELLADVDLVLDGVDNFRAKFALCAAALRAGVPFIYGALSGTMGVSMPVLPGETACLGCVYGAEPDQASSETAATAGVIGPTVEIVSSLQVANAYKLLVGAREEVLLGLTHFDIWDGEFRVLPWERDPGCALCGSEGAIPAR